MNQIDLEYLTNPYLKRKKEVKTNITKELSFYNKRIISLTTKLLNGEKISHSVDSGFYKYALMCIEHFKFVDKRDIIQEN